jgi:hypothetical protein
MDPLFILAEKKQLPAHQYMDSETLSWIIANNPFQGQCYIDSTNTSKIFKKINASRLPENWSFTPEEVDTIHGLRHVIRVAINGLNLLQYGFAENDLEKTVLLSALFHDISRKDDHADEGHSERSAKWFLENIELIKKTFFQMEDIEKENIYYAILFHEEPLKNLVDKIEYLNHKRAVDLLKIADALDRYCQPKTKWWIDDEKIPLSPPISAKHFAYKLVVKSEGNHLKGMDNYTSVLEALKQIC